MDNPAHSEAFALGLLWCEGGDDGMRSRFRLRVRRSLAMPSVARPVFGDEEIKCFIQGAVDAVRDGPHSSILDPQVCWWMLAHCVRLPTDEEWAPLAGFLRRHESFDRLLRVFCGRARDEEDERWAWTEDTNTARSPWLTEGQRYRLMRRMRAPRSSSALFVGQLSTEGVRRRVLDGDLSRWFCEGGIETWAVDDKEALSILPVANEEDYRALERLIGSWRRIQALQNAPYEFDPKIVELLDSRASLST